MKLLASSLDYPQKDSIHLLLNNTTIDSTIFWQYLEELIKDQIEVEFSDKFFFLLAWDIATIHKTKIVRDLLVEHKMGLLTIKPYSPWLNPAEGYIASIKKKIRTQLERSKLLTKTLIKDWIKEAWNGDPERFVEASRKETMKIINRVKKPL